MRGSLLKKSSRAALFAAAVFACMELWARIDDYLVFGAPLLAEYSQESMLVLKDSSGVRGKPHGRFGKWSLNALGFRGPEIALEKPPGSLRIAAMGASETFGIYESPGMEWPRRLEAGLREAFPGRALEVVNTAFPGMGLESALHYYRSHVRPLHPDIIVLYLNALPFLDAPKGTVAVTQAPAAGGPVPAPSPFHPGKPRLFPKLNRALHTRGPAALVAYVEDSRLQRRYRRFPRAGQLLNLDSSQVQALRDRLGEFIDTLRQDGAALVLSEHAHALLVWDGESHPAAWLNLWLYRPAVSEREFRSGYPVLNAACRQVGEASGCTVVRQDTLLVAADSNFAADGIHFTDRGAALTAGNFLAALKPMLQSRFAAADTLPRFPR